MDDKGGQAPGPGAMGGPDTVLPPEGPREKLIDTAIKFLQNPKVRESDFAQRRAFLEKKGLTKEEIDIAVERSGTAGDQNRVPVGSTTSHPIVPGQSGAPVQPVTVTPPASAWSRLRDYIATFIVIGGVGYAAYKLYKRYLEPFLFGPSEEERTLQSLQKSMSEIQQSLPEILTTMKDLQTSVAQQQGSVQEVAASNERLRDGQYANELKEEIKSLKGLLLSRKQFPSTPVTKPVIPSWQLESASQPFDSTSETSVPSKCDGLTSSTAHVTFATAHGNTNTEVTEVPLGLESSPPVGVSLTEPIAKPASEPAAERVVTVTSEVHNASDEHEPQMNGEKEESAHLNGDLDLDHQDQEVKDTELQQVKGQVVSNTDQLKLDTVQQEQ